MKGDAADYALIYQVAEIFPKVKKMIHENILPGGWADSSALPCCY